MGPLSNLSSFTLRNVWPRYLSLYMIHTENLKSVLHNQKCSVLHSEMYGHIRYIRKFDKQSNITTSITSKKIKHEWFDNHINHETSSVTDNYQSHQLPLSSNLCDRLVHQAVLVCWAVMVHQTVLLPCGHHQPIWINNIKTWNHITIITSIILNIWYIWLNKLLNYTINMYVNKKLKCIECVNKKKKYLNIYNIISDFVSAIYDIYAIWNIWNIWR